MSCPACGHVGGAIKLDGNGFRPIMVCQCGHEYSPDGAPPPVVIPGPGPAPTAPLRPLPVARPQISLEDMAKQRLAEVQSELPAAIGRVAALKAEERWLRSTVAKMERSRPVQKQTKRVSGYPDGVVKLIKDIDEN